MPSHTIVLADHAQHENYQMTMSELVHVSTLRHDAARVVTLAEFGFTLILARISHVAPSTEMEFSLLALYGRQLLHPAAPSRANMASARWWWQWQRGNWCLFVLGRRWRQKDGHIYCTHQKIGDGRGLLKWPPFSGSTQQLTSRSRRPQWK